MIFKKNKTERSDELKKMNEILLKIEELSIFRLYNFYQHREPHQKEVNYWIKQIQEGKISSARIKENIMNTPLAKKIQREKLKKFGVILENDEVGFKEINENRIYFDPNDQALFEYSMLQFEKNLLQWKKMLKNFLKKDFTVMDIGANIGLYALLMADLVGEKGIVYAFEPSPKNFQFLKRNIEYNGYKNIEIFQNAMANKTGKVNMIARDSVHGSLIIKDRPHPKKIQVTTTTIDTFMDEIKRKIDFIFMDAEGFEEYIFKGGAKTIQNNVDLKIIAEYNPKTLVDAGTTPESFIDTISNFGFSMFVLEESTGEIEKINKNELLNKFSIKNEYPLPKFTNLYLTKE